MMIRGFQRDQRTLSQQQLNFGAFCRAAAPGFGSISHISQSRDGCFYTQPVLLKERSLPTQPLENKSGSRKAKVKSEAGSDFPHWPSGGNVEGAGWQMGPLGVHGFVTPYKALQSSRRTQSLPLPGDGSGITLPKSQHLPPCRDEAGPSSCLLWPQEHPFPAHLQRGPAGLCTHTRPRVIYGASAKSLRQRRVRSVTSCDVWVRTAWC